MGLHSTHGYVECVMLIFIAALSYQNSEFRKYLYGNLFSSLQLYSLLSLLLF
jgi:hypothetical protein